MEFSRFKKIVFETSRGTSGTLLSTFEPQVTPNFFAAHIAYEEHTFYALCSRDDFWCFVRTFEPNSCSLEFIDVPQFAGFLNSAFSITALAASELNGPIKNNIKISSEDAQYWKPHSLGEVLFNWWD